MRCSLIILFLASICFGAANIDSIACLKMRSDSIHVTKSQTIAGILKVDTIDIAGMNVIDSLKGDTAHYRSAKAANLYYGIAKGDSSYSYKDTTKILKTDSMRCIRGAYVGRLRQDSVWHAYGGFQDSSVTISISDANSWMQITNTTKNLWTGSEADGMALSGDTMTISNAGDYFGTISLSLSGLNGKDFAVRIYNVTHSVQEGFYISVSTTSESNFVNVTLPLYFEVEGVEKFVMETTCTTDGSDPIIKSAVFYLSYLHE